MFEKRRLFAVAFGMLLCSVVPAAAYAQEERPHTIVDDSLEAVTAVMKTTSAAKVAAGEGSRGYIAGRAGIDVQLLTLLPFGRAETGSANIVERSDRTVILATLTEIPPDLVSPSLIAEIHDGTCLDLKSGSSRATAESAAGYSLTPLGFSLRSFGAVLPVSLAVLRSSAHAVTVRADPEEGISAFACIDVA